MRAICLAVLVVALAGCSHARQSEAIDCPVAETGQVTDTIKETPAQIASAGQELHYGNSNAIPDVVSGVRQRHPNASKGAVVNYLLTAYCPALNTDATLTKKSRRQAMDSFAAQAEAAVK